MVLTLLMFVGLFVPAPAHPREPMRLLCRLFSQFVRNAACLVTDANSRVYARFFGIYAMAIMESIHAVHGRLWRHVVESVLADDEAWYDVGVIEDRP